MLELAAMLGVVRRRCTHIHCGAMVHTHCGETMRTHTLWGEGLCGDNAHTHTHIAHTYHGSMMCMQALMLIMVGWGQVPRERG